MGWIDQKPYIHPHTACKKPSPGPKGEAFGVGSIWQCDDCKTRWRYDGGKMQYDQRDHDSWFEAKWTKMDNVSGTHTGMYGAGPGYYDR